MTDYKVAVVTGGNKGIGFEIVKSLCKQFDGRVYLTSRNEERGHAAITKLNLLGLRPWYHQLDVEDAQSIEVFQRFLERTHGGLDVLINNAAIIYKRDSREPEWRQAEHTMRVNFFGALNVSRALFPLLRAHARVVYMSSTVGHISRICGHEPKASALKNQLTSPHLTERDLVQLMNEFVSVMKAGNARHFGWPVSSYAVSKVGIVALTGVHQRLWDESDVRRDVIVNCVHPGYVITDFTNDKGNLTPEQGAYLPVQLALLRENDPHAPRGKFIWSDGHILDWASGKTPGCQ